MNDVVRETADIVLHGRIGLLFASLDLIGPVAATAINNGSNVAAALNGLRRLVRRPAPATG